MIKFEWDAGNLKHIMEDYPERKNTVEEIENIFADPYFTIESDKFVNDEQRFIGVGKGINEILKVVVFIIKNDAIRPISCWVAKQKFKNYYYENVRQKENGA
jgi:uncharacterized DUF497 family protein